MALVAATLSAVLTDEEAADIRKKLEEGWRGPVLITWLCRLLDDREERVSTEPLDAPTVRTALEGDTRHG